MGLPASVRAGRLEACYVQMRRWLARSGMARPGPYVRGGFGRVSRSVVVGVYRGV